MPANLENSTVAFGLEKVSFNSNPKERQCQRMFKLPYDCTHFTCQQDYAQNPSSQALAVRELRTFKCTSWIQKRQRNQRSIANTHWIIEKAKKLQKKIYFWFIDYTKANDWMDHNQLWNILKHIGMPDHIPCLLRNLVCRTRSNNWNWTWNNEVVQNWERNTSRL